MQVLVVLPVHSVYAVQAVNAFHPLDADETPLALKLSPCATLCTRVL